MNDRDQHLIDSGTLDPEAGLSRRGARMVGTGGEILTECFCAAGTDYVFHVNSTGQTPFYDALMTRPDLKLIVALQEGQAVSMAHGYELASGKAGILMLPGIGIPNALSNLYNARKDCSSLVIFSDGPDTGLTGRDGFQQVENLLSTTANFTKWQWTVDDPDRISEIVRRGIKIATTPVGGPVYVRLPTNIMSASDVEATIYPQSLFTVDVRTEPKSEAIERAARLLIEAEAPIINAGAEVTRAGANQDLVELAELLSIPVTQGYSVFLRFPLSSSSLRRLLLDGISENRIEDRYFVKPRFNDAGPEYHNGPGSGFSKSYRCAYRVRKNCGNVPDGRSYRGRRQRNDAGIDRCHFQHDNRGATPKGMR